MALSPARGGSLGDIGAAEPLGSPENDGIRHAPKAWQPVRSSRNEAAQRTATFPSFLPPSTPCRDMCARPPSSRRRPEPTTPASGGEIGRCPQPHRERSPLRQPGLRATPLPSVATRPARADEAPGTQGVASAAAWPGGNAVIDGFRASALPPCGQVDPELAFRRRGPALAPRGPRLSTTHT